MLRTDHEIMSLGTARTTHDTSVSSAYDWLMDTVEKRPFHMFPFLGLQLWDSNLKHYECSANKMTAKLCPEAALQNKIQLECVATIEILGYTWRENSVR